MLIDCRREIVEVGVKMVKSGLVKGTWGNLSIKNEELVYITPSGVSYEELIPEEIAVVNSITGLQIEGRLKCSSELPMHLTIYQKFKELKGIVHTHSVYASSFAALGEKIPCYTEDQAQIIGGSVPIAQYASPGTEQLGKNVVEALKTGKYAALLGKHGLVAVGRSLKEAFMAAEVAEKSAQIAFLVKTMNQGGIPIGEEEIELMRRNYLNSYSKNIIKEGV